jgi:hypothetical protein
MSRGAEEGAHLVAALGRDGGQDGVEDRVQLVVGALAVVGHQIPACRRPVATLTPARCETLTPALSLCAGRGGAWAKRARCGIEHMFVFARNPIP